MKKREHRSALFGDPIAMPRLQQPDWNARRTLPRHARFAVAYCIQSWDATFRSNLAFFTEHGGEFLRHLFLLSYGGPVPHALHFPHSTVSEGRYALTLAVTEALWNGAL